MKRLADDGEAWQQSSFDLLPDAHRQLIDAANATALDFGDAGERTLEQVVAETARRASEPSGRPIAAS